MLLSLQGRIQGAKGSVPVCLNLSKCSCVNVKASGAYVEGRGVMLASKQGRLQGAKRIVPVCLKIRCSCVNIKTHGRISRVKENCLQ